MRVTRRSALLLALGCWIAAAPAAAIAQTPPAEAGRFKTEIDAFRQWDTKNFVPKHGVLFVGSSSIRFWPTADRFPSLPVINRGFGGSEISDVNFYIQDVALKYAADVIVFYAGDNDIHAGKTPARVLGDYQTFASRVLAAKPDTEIVFIAIKPSLARWSEWDAMRQANALVEQSSSTRKHLHYVDFSPQMLGADGRPKPELFVADGLHMTPAGYDIWSTALSKMIPTLLTAPPAK